MKTAYWPFKKKIHINGLSKSTICVFYYQKAFCIMLLGGLFAFNGQGLLEVFFAVCLWPLCAAVQSGVCPSLSDWVIEPPYVAGQPLHPGCWMPIFLCWVPVGMYKLCPWVSVGWSICMHKPLTARPYSKRGKPSACKFMKISVSFIKWGLAFCFVSERQLPLLHDHDHDHGISIVTVAGAHTT